MYFFVLSCVTHYGLFYCTIGFVLGHWRLIAPLELYCAIVSRYNLSFKWSGKVVFFNLFCHFSFYFFAPAAFILVLDTIWVSSDEERLWRIWRWFVIWCGEFVWQWRKFKREMWRSIFRKTLCGLKRNKGCWLNARRTKRMRLVGEVGWSIGECRLIFFNARRRLAQNRVYP